MIEGAETFEPNWVSPPGDTIADLLEEKGWSQKELAERCGYTRKHVNLLVSGKAPITEDTALKLERVLGGNARFWLTREAQYRERLARRRELETLECDVDWLDELPLRDMIRFGWVERRSPKAAQVLECLKFFGVSSVAAWRSRYGEPLAAFKASDKFEMNGAAVSAWLRRGEIVAEGRSCAPFDRAAFRGLLTELRGLTAETDPGTFIPRLIDACAKVGVAVVLEPAPRGCPVSGATRWLTKDKALLMLSLRYKTNDHLWFAFFHEAGHLLLHGKKMVFLETKGLDDEHEREANEFAANLLIPPAHARRLPELGQTPQAIEAFAKEIGIAPGIVVGRMQKEGILPWGTKLNRLKVSYCWPHEAH